MRLDRENKLRVTTSDRAQQLRLRWYFPTDEPCSKHGSEISRYTLTGECRACLTDRHIQTYNYWRLVEDAPTSAAAALHMQDNNIEFNVSFIAFVGTWLGDYGPNYYMSQKHCKRGHIGLRFIRNGRCAECSFSPRQHAIANKQPTYMPLVPCKNGHIAPVSVHNGSCSECMKNIPRKEPQPAKRGTEIFPSGTVITRKDARKQGLKHYITGEKCSRGHVSARYVSTGGCIECKLGG